MAEARTIEVLAQDEVTKVCSAWLRGQTPGTEFSQAELDLHLGLAIRWEEEQRLGAQLLKLVLRGDLAIVGFQPDPDAIDARLRAR